MSSHNKRINQYTVFNDIAISIKFDIDELEELMGYREAVASNKTLSKFFYQMMKELKASKSLEENRCLVGIDSSGCSSKSL